MTPVGKTGPSNATIMFYTETPELSVPTDESSRKVGDKIYIYAQAFPVVGEGDDQFAKAAWLNAGNALGSEWSTGSSVTIA